MDETDIALTGNEEEANQALCGRLAILNNSQALLRTIFLGIGMQYKALDEQRCRLLEGTDSGNDIKSIQIAASLIVLSALLGFQKQAQCIAGQECEAGVCPDNTELTAGALVITAALMRLFKLAGRQNAAAPGQTEAPGGITPPVI